MKIISRTTHVMASPPYKPGDPMPEGYIARQDWAQAHLDAGLKQKPCGNCGLWKFPHEMSGKWCSMPANTRKNGTGRGVVLTSQLCKDCEKKFPKLGRNGRPRGAVELDPASDTR